MYCAIDVETTGFDEKICSIIEFGAVLDDLKSPIEKLPTFHVYIDRENYTGEPAALAMHSEIFKRIANKEGTLCKHENLMSDFATFLEKNNVKKGEDGKLFVQVAGKNFGTFDFQFVKKFFPYCPKINFGHRFVDPAMYFYNPLLDEKLPNLQTCLEKAGLPSEVTHTALEDAFQIVKLIRKNFTIESI